MAKLKSLLAGVSNLWENLRQAMKTESWLSLAFGFGLSLLLAVSGQLVLSANLGKLLGIGLYIVSSLILMLVLALASRYAPPTEAEVSLIRGSILPFVFGLLGLICLSYVFPNLSTDPRLTGWDKYYPLFAWLGSLVSFSVAILLLSREPFPGLQQLSQTVRENRWEILSVLVIFLLALGVRLYRINDFPYPFLKDEAQLGLEALQVARGQITNLFWIGWAGDPFMSSLPEALGIRLFGHTVLGVRILPVILGALTVPILYCLTRDLFDRLTATLAALGLVAIPMHVHFSRLGVNNIIVGFWAVLIFWLTNRAIVKGRIRDYLLAGIVTGLPLYSYLGSRLISTIGALMLLFCVLTRRDFLKNYWRHLLVYGVILIIVVAPRFYGAPDMVAASFRTDNIFNNHWLISEPINSRRSIPEALLDQFYRSTFVFISVSAWGGFFNSPKPFLFPAAALTFVFGLFYSLFRLRELRHLLLHVWFWSIVILGSVLYAVAPNAEKMVAGMPVAALLSALGLVQVFEILKKMRLIPTRWLYLLAVGVVAFSQVQGALYYFVEYQETRMFARREEEVEQGVSLYVASLGPNYEMNFLVSPPLNVNYFPARDYLLPDIVYRDFGPVTPEAVAALSRQKGQVFIASNDRKADLEAIQRLLPGGVFREVPRLPIPDWPAEILYYSYKVPPAGQ